MHRHPSTGQIVINPNPEMPGGFTGTGRFSMHRNAQKKVVAALLEKGWLAESADGQFTVTPSGRCVLDAELDGAP